MQKTRSSCRRSYLPLPAVFLGLKPRRTVTARAGRHSRADAMRSTMLSAETYSAAGDFVEGRDPVHMGSPIAEKMHFAI